jgi:hypothetical protein
MFCALTFSQKEVHGPTAAHVALSLLTEVLEHVFVGAPSLLKGVGEHGEPGRIKKSFGENPLLVSGLGKLHGCADVPGERGWGHGLHVAERVSVDVQEQAVLR